MDIKNAANKTNAGEREGLGAAHTHNAPQPPPDGQTSKVAEVDGSSTPRGDPNEPLSDFQPRYRFWIIMACFAIIGFLGSLENGIVGVVLPDIVRDLEIGENYIWVANIQLLTR